VKLEAKNFEFSPKMQKVTIVGIIIGLISTVAAFVCDPTTAWISVLTNNVYFVMIAATALFYMCIQGIAHASWMAPYRRLTESMTTFLPVGFVLMLAMYFGMHSIYEWTHADIVMNDKIIRGKTPYLNTGFFMVRMVVMFVLWIAFSKILKGFSKQHDTEYSEELNNKIVKWSSIGTIVFSLTICMAAFDWMMSIEPHWFSTIYGVYVFAGAFVSTAAFLCLANIYLMDKGYLEGILTIEHLHDLGKLMFGFSVFWAYIWISQYLLIWYSNIPEETEYYLLRGHHGFKPFFWVTIFTNFLFPFFALMTRAAKRSVKRLKLVATVILLGHWIDIYVMIAPKVVEHHHGHAHIGLTEIGMFIGYFSLFVFVVGKSFAKVNIIAKHDPYLPEGVSLHQ
jgi:hypothetical protein